MIVDIAVCRALWSTENSVMAHYLAMAHRLKTSGLDPWVLLDCWVSMEFLHAPIIRTVSGSTNQPTNQDSVNTQPPDEIVFLKVQPYFLGEIIFY